MPIGPNEQTWWCHACGRDLPDRQMGGSSNCCSDECREWYAKDVAREKAEQRKARREALKRERWAKLGVTS